MISAHIPILSLSLLTILLLTPYCINYIFSEPIIAQKLLHPTLNENIENKTLTNTGCDFLNLCDEHISTKLNGISLPMNNNVIDISFFNSYIDLPFP
jgi:hypothetical protein